MSVRKFFRDDSGFSLVEVILAVAILALVTLPLINYFTYSALQTIDGRDRHMATLAGKQVMEELRSYSNYDQIEALTEKEGWDEVTADANANYTDLARTVNMTLNGSDYPYQAKVHVQYSDYKSDTRTVDGDAIDAEYNDYQIPTPSEVYSSSNVVAAEDDQIDLALSALYIDTKATVPKATIQSQMQRTMCIDVSYLDESVKDIYVVKVYYRYTYDTFTEEIPVEETNIEKDKLQNIYLFYNLLRADVTDEQLEVTFGTGLTGKSGDDLGDIGKLQIFLVYQQGSITKPTAYKIVRTATSSTLAGDATYYTNVLDDSGNPNIVGFSGGSLEKLVKYTTKKRIASVTVDIYEEDDTSCSNSVAHLETTMAE